MIILNILYLVFTLLVLFAPVWLPMLVLKIQYGKSREMIENEAAPEVRLFKYLWQRDKSVFINFIFSLIILGVMYYYFRPTTENCYENFLCGVFLVPVFLAGITVFGSLIYRLVSDAAIFYHPENKLSIIKKVNKIFIYIIVVCIILMVLAPIVFSSFS